MSDQKLSPNQTDQLDLVYGLNDRPRPIIAFLAAFQHLLAIIVPIVTPGLLICLALGVSKEDTTTLAACATKLPAPSVFTHLDILRHKESDRLEGIVALLGLRGSSSSCVPRR